jgi:single-stranded DNA-binding protein
VIAALIQGKLASEPTRRTAKNGQDFATASVRVAVGETAIFVSVIAFGETDVERLTTIGKGSPVAIAGTLESREWVHEGETRHGWSLTASEVLTLHAVKARQGKATRNRD